ncbi:cation diffusion facilitator family transporter [[Eubacterium] yurii subsp. margaretiae ATCC 43715]|nr:cation diffusion facilitator family transporter [[Eubacterium] yurii subsp. margaretiae ATCC 43715]
MSNESIEILAQKRERAIIRTSMIGVGTNVMLAVFKAIIGLISNSIAITLDAVNNISDALSSVITIIGTKLGAKEPDKNHPLGHGRIEYISSMVVAAIVLYAGITSLVESIKKIISPEKASYDIISLVIIGVAVLVKVLLGKYVKKQGVKHNSGALIASGSDALFDALISASVLASAIIYLAFDISLEAYVGVLISIFIIKAGIEMMTETISEILGKRSDKEDIDKIKNIIAEEKEVRGVYDLIIFNFGPSKNYASVHIELDDTMTVDEVDVLTRKIEAKVYQQSGVILTGVGVYSHNTSNEEVAVIKNTVKEKVLSFDWALQMHGFYVDMEEKSIRLDVVISFDIEKEKALSILTESIRQLYPTYSIKITTDLDV